MSYVDSADFKTLFIEELGWDQPTAKPLTVEVDDTSFVVTPVAGFHGLHVWACGSLPDRTTQAKIDRVVSATSTERLIIFHDAAVQEWRWPRYNKNRGTSMSKLLVHEHTIGNDHSALERRLKKIALDIDDEISLVQLLERMRTAFDVEESEESSKAAKVMAKLYYELEAHLPQEGPEATDNLHKISVTMTRILFLVFADDTMMWDEESLFQNFVAFETERDGSDLAAKLELLFSVLNTDKKSRSGVSGYLSRFKYVNGGIFAEDIKLPDLSAKMRDLLIEASRFDWGNISPAIFGSMFQAVKSKELRRELGAHYTSEKDILKTLNPLFLDELHQEFERTKALKDPSRPLKALRERLGQIKILDPACGCGNFLIVAYRELRELELQIMESLNDRKFDDGSRTLDATLELKVSLDQIHGIEIDEWPARIAETALHLMDRQCNLRLIEKFGHAPERLPISVSAKIHTSTVAEPDGGNALAQDWTTVFPPGPENFIVGNPPFIGMSWMSADQQRENRKVFAALPEAKGHRTGRLDYVACWYAKAFTYIQQTGASCAFVSTNSIIQGDQARVMDPIMRAMGIGIKFGHRTFKWKSEASGAAAVHCTIIGFSKASSIGSRRLFDYPSIDGPPTELTAKNLNFYLLDTDLPAPLKRSTPLVAGLPKMTQGNKPWPVAGLLVKTGELLQVESDPVAKKYLRPFVQGRDMLYSVPNWCIWMPEFVRADADASPELRRRFEVVRSERLKPSAHSVAHLASSPNRFAQIRQPTSRYLALPEVSSETRDYVPMRFYEADVVAGNKLMCIDNAPIWLFGVLSSLAYTSWIRTFAGKLESRFSISPDLAYSAFPFIIPKQDSKRAIEQAAQSVLDIRENYLGMTLSELYKPANMPKDLKAAHTKLDRLVDDLYGLTAPLPAERATKLLALHHKMQATQ